MIFKSASGLALSFKKCMLIPLWQVDHSDLKQWISRHVCDAKNCEISGMAKYLGIMVGPESACISWRGPTAKYLERTRMIRTAGNGLCQSLADYKIYAVSVLSHVAQFEYAPAETMKAEAKALQMMAAGPWNAINKELMIQLTDIGYAIEAPSIDFTARAAMFRFANQSRVFSKCIKMMEEARRDDDDVVLVPKLQEWHRIAHITAINKNYTNPAACRREPTLYLRTTCKHTFIRCCADRNARKLLPV
jgi:hypothetical protein